MSPIDHSECLSRLEAYMDGELATVPAGEVEEHLGHCSSCRARLSELRRVGVLLRELPRERMPADLAVRIRSIEGSADAAPPPGGKVWSPWPVATLAGAALLVVIVVLVGMPRQTEPPLQPTTDQLGPSSTEIAQPRRTDEVPSTTSEEAPSADRFAAPKKSRGAGEPAVMQDVVEDRVKDESMVERQEYEELREGIGRVVEGSVSGEKKDEMSFSPDPETQPEAPTVREKDGDTIEKKLASPAAGPLDDRANRSRVLAVTIHGYVSRLTVSSSGDLSLSPLQPIDADSRSMPSVSPAEPIAMKRDAGAEDAPSAVMDDAAEKGQVHREERVEAYSASAPDRRLVFLVRPDASGTILAAQLVGARTTSQALASAIRDLLIGSTIPPPGIEDAAQVTVQVIVPPDAE